MSSWDKVRSWMRHRWLLSRHEDVQERGGSKRERGCLDDCEMCTVDWCTDCVFVTHQAQALVSSELDYW